MNALRVVIVVIVALVVIFELGIIFIGLLGVPPPIFFMVLIGIAGFGIWEEWSSRAGKRLQKKSNRRPTNTPR